MPTDLVAKYGDARIPRYTSYPTAPRFSDAIGASHFSDWIGQIGNAQTSLYLHIPFCRSMCWYCGCHTSITERDQPILDYLDILHREIDLVARAAGQPLDIREVHFGGGTPTIVSPDEFLALMAALGRRFKIDAAANIAVEIDPRRLTADMASALGAGRVNRASLGVQSFDPVVQKAINRIQSEETTALAVEHLRGNGIGRINFDLIYGLPHQTVQSCVDTVSAALAMRPDRFSVFGYAHIPSFKKHQRLIDENALPDTDARNAQAEAIAAALAAAGYVAVGLDHFALPGDELALAAGASELRRNFQGYTTDGCTALIGLGASAIGRLRQGYAQNEVPPGVYARRIAEGRLATAKGYCLTEDDRLRGAVIERLMCDFEVDLTTVCEANGARPDALLAGNAVLSAMVDDGVVEIRDGIVRMIAAQRFLVRAVASAFDAYFLQSGRNFGKAA